MTINSATYLKSLHELLFEHFSLEEIRTLCFNLHVDYESTSGAEKQAVIWDLLLGSGRTGRLPDLIAIARQLCPHVKCPSLPDDFILPEYLVRETAMITLAHSFGDVVQGDVVHGDKVMDNKIQAQTYVEKQVIVHGTELMDLKNLSPEEGSPPIQACTILRRKTLIGSLGGNR